MGAGEELGPKASRSRRIDLSTGRVVCRLRRREPPQLLPRRRARFNRWRIWQGSREPDQSWSGFRKETRRDCRRPQRGLAAFPFPPSSLSKGGAVLSTTNPFISPACGLPDADLFGQLGREHPSAGRRRRGAGVAAPAAESASRCHAGRAVPHRCTRKSLLPPHRRARFDRSGGHNLPARWEARN